MVPLRSLASGSLEIGPQFENGEASGALASLPDGVRGDIARLCEVAAFEPAARHSS